LFSPGAVDPCQVTVTQPRFQEVNYSMHTVFLKCVFSPSGCSSSPPEILWFQFLIDKHEDLCTPTCRDDQKYKVHSLSGNEISLQINNLTAEDNAVYICGVAFVDSNSPRSKHAGDGTTLIKTEKQHSKGKLIFMVIASSLLFLYSAVLFTLFVVYKKISSGRKIFQAIAQELQKQRYAEHCQQPDDLEDETVYQNR
ncbi:IGSF6 protein, partial [Turnix velox]|nr:IGSF6 protein [Turnix velox]